jgi:hypothetical protein
MLIAFASAKGAPGTTTTALAVALAWPQPVILADLDARGGDVTWTYGQGQDTQGRGLLGLQVAARREPWAAVMWSQLVALTGTGTGTGTGTRTGTGTGSADGGRRWLLPGLDAPQHAGSIDWAGLAGALSGLPVDVIADCGSVRAVHAPAAVWAAADLVVLAVRPSLVNIHATRAAAELVRGDLRATGLGPERLGSVLIGPGRPYPTSEVTRSLAETCPVLGELPWDPATAAALGSGRAGGRRFASSPLIRGAATIAHTLGGRVLALAPALGRPTHPNTDRPGEH